MITADQARAIWRYVPETGELFWRGKASRRWPAGMPAGAINSWGYRLVSHKGVRYVAARLIWLIVTGQWPSFEIDHKNTNAADDRWDNLREATRGENQCNRKVQSNNRLGVKGVCPARGGRYAAFICRAGKRKNLGTFDTVATAKVAYDLAAQKWHGNFAQR